MTFAELQAAVQFGRFKPSSNSYIKTWLNTRYARIWTAFEWTFRIAEPTTVSCLPGSRYLGDALSTFVLPVDFGDARDLYDDNVAELEQLEEREFTRRFAYSRVKGLTGRPEAFTVVNRKVILGPVPDQAYPFTLAYKRLLSHYSGGAIVRGPLTVDNDEPLWPSEHHEVLVVGAQALGLKLIADPEWIALEQQHDDLVAGMLADGLVQDDAVPRQYGRDRL